MRGRWRGLKGLWLACALAACSSEETSPSGARCTPGQSAQCACANGQTGAQICQSDGTFAGCVCGGSGGGAGHASGGTGGQSTGGGAGQSIGGTGGSVPGESLTGEWSKVFPGGFEIAALAVDASGPLVVAGASSAPVDFGNGPVGKTMTGWAKQLLIAGFDSSGQRKFAFAKDAGRIDAQTLSIRPVAQDRIVVQGETTVISQGSGPSVKYTLVWPCGTAPSSIGSGVHFVVELDQVGNCIWDHTYPADGYSQLPTAVVSPKDGSVFVTAVGQWGTPVTRRYLANGTESWQKAFGGSALTALSTGHVLLASYNPLTLPSGTVAGLFALARLDSTGGVVAGNAWGTSVYDPTRQLVGFDIGGNDLVALALRYTGTVDLGGGPRTSTNAGASPSNSRARPPRTLRAGGRHASVRARCGRRLPRRHAARPLARGLEPREVGQSGRICSPRSARSLRFSAPRDVRDDDGLAVRLLVRLAVGDRQEQPPWVAKPAHHAGPRRNPCSPVTVISSAASKPSPNAPTRCAPCPPARRLPSGQCSALENSASRCRGRVRRPLLPTRARLPNDSAARTDSWS